jgi:hypothetical protein
MSKNKEFLETRLIEIQKALQESATVHKNIQLSLEQQTAHHNTLMGRLNETQFLLSELFKEESNAVS